MTADPGEIGRLIEDLRRAKSELPIPAIEALIAAGDTAVGSLIEALNEIEPDDDDWTPLWITIALGELRKTEAAPALIRLLDLPEGDVLSEAAAEALAKIGRSTFPYLARFAREARAWEARNYAYLAIGQIPAPECRQFLVDALGTDVLLWNTLAIALADQGDPASLPALKEILPRCDDRETPAVREAVEILEGRQPPYPKLREKDWRTRYWGIIGA